MIKTTITTSVATLALTILCSAPAHGVREAGYSVDVLVNSKPLQVHCARGSRYIEASDGAEYAIRLVNHTGERIAIALAVDGLNSIDAKTTSARQAAKWVLGPYETVTVDGWQTTSDTARRFFFTSEAGSYGAWLGKTNNLGVIEAVVYRERKPIRKPWTTGRRSPGAADGKAAPSEPTQESSRRQRDAEAPTLGEGLSDDLAATGIGREVDNPVRRVRFVAESKPAANIRIRYEYREQLVRLGVLPQPQDVTALERRERAHGFSDFDFAPDPYRESR